VNHFQVQVYIWSSLTSQKTRRIFLQSATLTTTYIPFFFVLLLLLVFLFCFVLFCSTGVWTQGLHVEPLQSFWWVFPDRVSQTIHSHWLRTAVLLISASGVTRITGVSHQYQATSHFSLLPLQVNSTWKCEAKSQGFSFTTSLHEPMAS
jgi:hypothetical protein